MKADLKWLEDQDFFRFSGIFREVYLYAKPEIHVEDLWVKTGLLDDYQTGWMEIEGKASALDSTKDAEIFWELRDAQGNPIKDGKMTVEEDGHCSGLLRCSHLSLSGSEFMVSVV